MSGSRFSRTWSRLGALLALAALAWPSPATGHAAGSDVGSAWEPANGGRYGAVIYALVRDPNNPAIRYAGGTRGVARTFDSMATWSTANLGLTPGCQVEALLPLREQPATLFAGCYGADYGNGLYRSDDRGGHWQSAGTGMLPNVAVYALIEGHGPEAPLLAGTETGIYRSLDGGLTWSLILKGTGGVIAAYGFAGDPFSALTFYTVTTNGPYKSVDGGATWFPIANDLADAGTLLEVATDPTRRNRLFLGTEQNGIYRSTDGGNSWTHLDNSPSHAYALLVQPLQAVPSDELTPDLRKDLATQLALAHAKLKKGQTRRTPDTALVLAGTDNGIQASTDAGDDWGDRTADANSNLPSSAKPFPTLPDSTPIFALLSFGRSAEIVAGGSRDGVYRSPDLGRSWRRSGPGLLADAAITALAVDPAHPGVVYFGTGGAGVVTSDDAGHSLADFSDGLPRNATINDLLIEPSRGDRLVAALGAPSGGVAISASGSGWSRTSLGGRYVNVVVADPHDPDTLYAGLSRDGIGWSADGGATWTILNHGLPRAAAVRSLAVDPHDALHILAGTDVGLYVTTDQSDTWQASSVLPAGPVTALLALPGRRGAFLVGAPQGAFLVRDTATPAVPVTQLNGVAVSRLVADPVRPHVVYATTKVGVFASADDGVTWTALDAGLPSGDGASAFAAAGAVDYVATSHGAFYRSPTGPVSSPSAGRYFAITGHTVTAPFLAFWQAHGGVAVFGYPRTEALREGGVLVQYFQRARLEYHPGIHGVVLTPLGSAFTKGRGFGRIAPFRNGKLRIYILATGHSLAAPFLAFWRAHGGAAVFGYPISEVLHEENGDGTGNAYVLQYFQNARLEYHPEATDPRFTVQLGLLGDQLLRQKGWLQ